MPFADVIIISSEDVPEGYVSLLNGPTLVWYGKVRNIPDDIEYNRVVVNPVDYRACFDTEVAARTKSLENCVVVGVQ
jgi:hypothetical protein